MANKLVSFIIINYNGGKVVLDCIRSVFEQNYKKIEVILVDNGSKDGSVEKIRKKFPKTKILDFKNNRGYAGGINEGYRISKGDYIVSMNNDLILNKKIIENLLKRNEEGEILGVKNYYYEKPDTLWATGVNVNPLLMKARLVGIHEQDRGQYDQMNFKEVVGSFLFIKREVFEKIKGFNEEYFCYYEESEFQERAKRKNFRVKFVPEATLLHHVAYSSGGGSNKITDYYLVRNRGKFIRDYQKIYFKPISYLSLLVEAFLRSIKHLIKLRFKDSLYPFRGLIDFILGKGGKLDE